MNEMLTVFKILKESEGILSVSHKIDGHKNCNDTRFLVQCPEKWNYFNSVLFSLVTITTIGYGHQVPNTDVGRILCVVYAIIGIPLVGFFVYWVVFQKCHKKVRKWLRMTKIDLFRPKMT